MVLPWFRTTLRWFDQFEINYWFKIMFKVGRRPCLGSGTQCAYKRYHLPGTWSVPRYLITSQVPEHHHSRCNGFRHGRHHQSHHHHRHHEGNLCHLFLGNSIGGRRGFSKKRWHKRRDVACAELARAASSTASALGAGLCGSFARQLFCFLCNQVNHVRNS